MQDYVTKITWLFGHIWTIRFGILTFKYWNRRPIRYSQACSVFSGRLGGRFGSSVRFGILTHRSWVTICKIENKRHFVRENFFIFGIFIEKITIYYENHVYSAQMQLPYTSPPIAFGLPIRVASVRDTSFTYLTILFKHKKWQNIIVAALFADP